ncbi:MAG: hypothetical protein G01um101425_305 [Candidatus Peregrinibacteria bacterium Gr01-1014_25]|nr:MAG: hypothetical protein G01um101425_305 [Candidatus Peregrinibacteria bacterium Gr01-1014_25]
MSNDPKRAPDTVHDDCSHMTVMVPLEPVGGGMFNVPDGIPVRVPEPESVIESLTVEGQLALVSEDRASCGVYMDRDAHGEKLPMSHRRIEWVAMETILKLNRHLCFPGQTINVNTSETGELTDT